MKKIKLLLILTVLMTCMGCAYSGKGAASFGSSGFSIETSWDGTIITKAKLLGIDLPIIFRFGFGEQGIKNVMGSPSPKKGESD